MLNITHAFNCSGCKKHLVLANHSIMNIKYSVAGKQTNTSLCTRCSRNDLLLNTIRNIADCFICRLKIPDTDSYNHSMYFDRQDFRVLTITCSVKCYKTYLSECDLITSNPIYKLESLCRHCRKRTSDFIRCNRCDTVTYCNTTCMNSDRKNHRTECNLYLKKK